MAIAKAKVYPGDHEPEQAPKFTLEHLNRKRSIPLHKSIVLGRSEGDEKFTHDSLMSARHVRVQIEGSKVFAVDLNSTNGTKINEHKLEVRQRVPFHHGDILKVGRQRFRLKNIEKIEKIKKRRRFFPHFKLNSLSFSLLFSLFCPFLFAGLTLLFFSDLIYENWNFRTELHSIVGDEASEEVIEIADSLRMSTSHQTCAQYGVSDPMKCLGKMIQSLSSKGISLTACKELYILNSVLLHNELMATAPSNPSSDQLSDPVSNPLSDPKKLELKADALENALLILEAILAKTNSPKSLKLSTLLEKLAISSNIALLYPYLDQAFSKNEDLPGDLRAHYTLLKPKLLEAGTQTGLEEGLSHGLGLVSPELDRKIGE